MARDPSSPRGGLDPTFDIDAAPRVAGNTSLWPTAFGIVGALGLGTVVFLQLDGNRQRMEEAKLAAAKPTVQPVVVQQPAPVYVPPEPSPPPPPPEPPPMIEVQPAPPPVNPGPTQAELDRLRAPALVIDLSEYGRTAPGASGPQQGGAPLSPGAISNAAGAATQSADERFAQKFGADTSKPARATTMHNLSTTVVEGAIIPAVLETGLNSDLPGYVRAMVTRDVRGFDGTKVLIPQGARLIGQYKGGVALGQRRAFVIWTRLIRPDGATVDLGAPATDGLGQGGLTGKVDTHFFERFGGAMLLSLLNIGAGAVADSSDTTVVIASTRDAASSALQGGENVSPTVTVPQGTPVRVFVNQDIDFSAVGPAKPADSN